jgi:hypothetical protein
MNADERRSERDACHDDDPQEVDLEWAAKQDESDSGDDTIECPECGRKLHWAAQRCPGCGTWLTGDSPAAQRSRGYFWPVMVAILIAVILVIWNGLR